MNRLAVILGLTLIACGSAPRAADAAEPVAPRTVGPPRVLFVDHWPRWEFRFIKDALIKDGAYRAQILLTSADESFPQDRSPGQDAIKEFPSDLLDYDVLILGDVPLEKIGGNEGAKMIVDFVKQGRGLILLAGTENNPHKYAGTPLEALLPVDGDAPLPADQYETGWPYKLTDAGRAHVVTKWDRHSDLNSADTWEGTADGRPNLQRVRFYAVPRKVKEGAVELVRLHNLAKETMIPLFVTMNVGAGRVFFSATDETYRWRYMHGNEPFFWPFWKRAIAWAAKP